MCARASNYTTFDIEVFRTNQSRTGPKPDPKTELNLRHVNLRDKTLKSLTSAVNIVAFDTLEHFVGHTRALLQKRLVPLRRLHCNKHQSHCWSEFAGNTMSQFDTGGATRRAQSVGPRV